MSLPQGVDPAAIGWALAPLLVVLWGLRVWTGSTSVGWTNPVALGFVLAGLAGSVWILASGRAPARATQALIMLLLAGAIGCWAYVEVGLSPAYGTDELAFDQYAAHLLVHGMNPYVHSMLPSLQRYLVPPIYHTYRLDGGEVSRVSYPALSFVAYVPALLFGLHMQAAVFTDLAAWFAGFLLLWRLLPAGVAWIAPLLLGLVTYANFVVGGVTDALFVPFLVLAVWRWDRYGDPAERGCARWLSPLALGLALAVKQTPWFLLPFLLIGLAHEGRRRSPRASLALPLRYTAVAAAVFLAVNAPFIAADPASWLRSVLLPLRSPTVPGGQGIVDLALFERAGGFLDWYFVAAFLALVTALLVFALHYRTFKRAWVALVALVFFWPTRSFASYLIDLAPAAILAASSVRPVAASESQGHRRRRVTAIVVPAAAFVAALVYALATPGPLHVDVVGYSTTGQLRTVDGIEVLVSNRSDRPLTPHFAVLNGGYLTSFWYPLQGGTVLRKAIVPAHGSRHFLLRAPNPQSMPALEGGFQLEAFTAHPATVDTSATVPPSKRRLLLLPNAINRPVPIGTPIRLTVQLADRLGNPVRASGVPISLGQVVYGQYALDPGEASIDGHPEGQSPVTVRTDTSGTARFTVAGQQAQPAPVFFQAWIAPSRSAPSGFSNLLSVQFVSPRRGR